MLGPRLQIECPVMCGLCGSTTTVTTTTTTTMTTTTTTTKDPVICEDHPSCPNQQAKYLKDGTGHTVEPCDCEDKCTHPLIGDELRKRCPVMCNECGTTTTVTTTTTTTTTTKTRTIPSECVDDVLCPTMVDKNGNDLCLCENVGDLVRAACPVMCNVCHRCTLPCTSENLASKTTLKREVTDQTTQTSTIVYDDGKIGAPEIYLGQNDVDIDLCQDPLGIPKGHTCIMAPIVQPGRDKALDQSPTHPCMDGQVYFNRNS